MEQPVTDDPLRVLLVEDEISLRDPLAKHLRHEHEYEVDPAADLQEARSLLAQVERPYDVALIDDLLAPAPKEEPEYVGLVLLREIKGRWPETEVIMFTGWGMERALEALRAGAYRYLAKPLNLDELGMTIRMAAERRRLKQQLETTKQEKEWLQTFLKIGMATTSVLELDEVLERVHEQVIRLIDASCLDVILYDESSQTLRFELGYDRGEREAKWERPFTQGKGLTDWVVEHCESLLIKDYSREEPPVPPYQRGEVSRSWLGVPLVMQDRVIGAITVQSYEPYQFDETHQQILTTVASQVASAIENARLFSELTETEEQLHALIASSFDAVVAIDQDRRITTFNQRAEEMFGWTASEMIGQTVAQLHVDIEKAREILDAVDRDGEIAGWNVKLKHRDDIMIPVSLSAALVRDRWGHPIGQAGFMRDLRQVNLLQERLRALMEATRAATGTLELQEVLNLVVESAVAAFPTADHGSIHLYDERANSLHLRVNSFGYSPDAIDALSFRVGEGIAGWVYEHGQPLLVANAQEDPRYKRIEHLEVLPHKSIICVPLKVKGKVTGVLSLDNLTTFGVFEADDLGLLSAFAEQAAIAIDNARLYEEMRLLYDLGMALNSSLNLEEVLDCIAKSALRLIQTETSTALVYDESKCRKNYIQRGVADTPERPVIVEEPRPDGFTNLVLKQGKPVIVSDMDRDERAKPFLLKTGVRSMVGVPIRLSGKVIGVLFVHSTMPRHFAKHEVALLSFLANQAAVAIGNARLFEEVERGSIRLRAAYEASKEITSTLDPDQSLQAIVEKTKVIGAWRASVVLIDEAGVPSHLASVGFEQNLEPATSIRPEGISIKVMRSGQPRFIPDIVVEGSEVHPKMIEQGVKAAACLPLEHRGRTIGVLWIHYAAPRPFSEAEKEALQLYAGQAAIAYDNARRMRELEHLRKAAEKLASVAGVREVLQQIVRSAREVLGAASAVIWSYDAVRQAFLPDELVADGIKPELVERFREDEPHPGGTADVVIQRKYLAVTDVGDPEYAYLGPTARGLRGAIGARSFQGIALRVGDETLGVLYVNYKLCRDFSDEDRATLETFAYHAALTLNKARLLEQVSKARDTAKVVAEVSVLEDLQSTLNSIARGTQDALDCDAVTLYTYDQNRYEFGFPPAMVGVRDTGEVLKLGLIVRESVIQGILALDEAHVAEDAPSDPVVGGAFVEREDIKSSVSIPLKVGDRKVGVMFVNYRSRHRFTGEELTNIELFAYQAAVAIRNAQLYEETVRRAAALQALYKAGKTVTSTLALDDILNRIVEQAWRLVEPLEEKAHFSHLALVDGNHLKFVAAHPRDVLTILREKIDLESDVPIGVTGRVVLTGKSRLVGNVLEDDDYIRTDPNVCSQLSVPIQMGGQVVGVIGVEHPDYNAFDKEDQRTLESLAAQAAIAIENARHYDELEKTKESLAAQTSVAWVGMVSSVWRHAIEKHALTIREQIQLLRLEIQKPSPRSPTIQEKLDIIERLANQILEKPMTPPLSAEEGVRSVPVNGFICERTRQLWTAEPYKSVSLRLDLSPDEAATVRASPEWLRRALDILVDNAVEAVSDLSQPQITITSRSVGNQAEIAVTDVGRGIPEEIRTNLFRAPISKPKGAKGLAWGY
jgi:PAS domain S-box-containing protein